MQLLGHYLKSEREKRGIRLEEIASSTKINIQNLLLIEEDRWSELPQEPFIRGFITAYAKYLGLDTQEILNRFYNSQKPTEDSQDNEVLSSTEQSPGVENSSTLRSQDFSTNTANSPAELKKFSLEPSKEIKGLAFVLLIILVIGFAASKIIESPDKQTESNPDTTAVSSTEPSSNETTVTSTSLPETNAANSSEQSSSTETSSTSSSTTSSSSSTTVPSSTTTNPPSTTSSTMTQAPMATPPSTSASTQNSDPKTAVTEGHILSVKIKNRTWSKLVIDDARPKETYLEANSEHTYEAKNKIKFVLGNATDSVVSYNGEESKGQKYSGTIRFYIFPKGARFPQDKPKKKESEEESSDDEGVPLQNSATKESE